MILDFVREQLPELVGVAQRRRSSAGSPGLGVASPFQLWTWEAEIGAPAGRNGRHGGTSTRRSEIAARLPLSGDAVQRRDRRLRGGVLLRPRLALPRLPLFLHRRFHRRRHRCSTARCDPGRTGNAGALGSMPVAPKGDGGGAPQLIACASIYQLERRLAAAGVDASSIWAHARRLGRLRRAARRLDRGDGRGPRLRVRRGHLRHRLRGDRHRRRDACGRARAADRAHR